MMLLSLLSAEAGLNTAVTTVCKPVTVHLQTYTSMRRNHEESQ